MRHRTGTSEKKMNDNKQLKDEERKTDEEYTGKTYAYIGLGLMAGAALFFGLSFTVMGIYSLIASILLSLASITFINLQKKKYDFSKASTSRRTG